jgi:hypothetical protein
VVTAPPPPRPRLVYMAPVEWGGAVLPGGPPPGRKREQHPEFKTEKNKMKGGSGGFLGPKPAPWSANGPTRHALWGPLHFPGSQAPPPPPRPPLFKVRPWTPISPLQAQLKDPGILCFYCHDLHLEVCISPAFFMSTSGQAQK